MNRLPLLLFDVDGTLLRAGDPTHGRAVTVACQQVFNVEGDLSRTELAGRTDRRILETLLATYGVPPAAIKPRLPEAFGVMSDYVDAHLPVSLADRVLPGVVDLLDAVAAAGLALGLVTGNLPRIAVAKLTRAGIWAPFERLAGGIGGFGDLSAQRADLVTAALATAERHLGFAAPGAAAVVIGDTPHDIDCGIACSARTIGVATGRYSVDDLRAAGASMVVHDLTATADLLQYILEYSPAA